jgi:penicillin-binding protein 1A
MKSRWAAFRTAYPITARLTKWLAAFLFLLFLIYCVFMLGFFGKIPTAKELREMQSLNASEIYTSDGVLIGRFYRENRTNIQFDALPKELVNMLVAVEDERYWDHDGVDMRAMARVFVRTIISRDESGGGGSTLSMQLAKNLYKRQHYWIGSTAIAKIREMLIARRLEDAFDKKALLAFYLNTVPFGNNAFGIQVASTRFFNKPPMELKLEEMAVLVGMLKANTTYNPRKNKEKSRERRNLVLQLMVKNNHLQQKVCDSIKAMPIALQFNPRHELSGLAVYFREYLKKELNEILKKYPKPDGETWDIYRDGLRVYTTLDSKMQQYAEDAAAEHMQALQVTFDEHWKDGKPWGDDKLIEDAMKRSPRWRDMKDDGVPEAKIRRSFNTKIPITLFTWEGEDERMMTPMDSIRYYYSLLSTGFMAMEAKTGMIRAWVGGNDYNFLQYDHVRSKRQVGSTFKPILYAKALQKGIRPCEYIPNVLRSYGGWTPHNADNRYGGAYSMEGALTNSVNTISVSLIMKTGVPAVIDFAHELGITADIPKYATIALGAVDISLYDMVRAYAAFPRRGMKVEPLAVVKILTRDGKTIVDFSKFDPMQQQRVLEEDHADMMVKMMQSVVEDGTAARLKHKYGITTDLAGKTGTTQSHADGWFVGYTPNLVFGAWVGGESPAVHFRDLKLGQGANTALPVCGLFLQKLYADPVYQWLKQEKFAQPAAWVLDSMRCDHKSYSTWELAEMDSLRQLDSTNRVDTAGISPPFNKPPVVVDTARKVPPKPPVVIPPVPTTSGAAPKPNSPAPTNPPLPTPSTGRIQGTSPAPAAPKPAVPPPGLSPAPRISGNKDGIIVRPSGEKRIPTQ